MPMVFEALAMLTHSQLWGRCVESRVLGLMLPTCGNQIEVVSGYRLPRGLGRSVKSLFPYAPWDDLSVVVPGVCKDRSAVSTHRHKCLLRAPSCHHCMKNRACPLPWRRPF